MATIVNITVLFTYTFVFLSSSKKLLYPTILVGWSVCMSKEFWPTSIKPKKLVFGMQLAFDPTKRGLTIYFNLNKKLVSIMEKIEQNDIVQSCIAVSTPSKSN